MRLPSVVVLLACAACAGPPQPGAPVAVPPPAPDSMQPASRPIPPDGGLKLDVCVVRNGRMEMVSTAYEAPPGDTLAGRPFAQVYGDTAGYAESATWFIRNEPITLAGRRYEKYGLARVLAPGDVVQIGEYQHVTVFAEPGATAPAASPPSIVYLPVRPGCEFQPYVSAVTTGTVRGL